MVLQVRKLAAIDLYFLGSKLIIAEFAVGVLGPVILGELTVRSGIKHGHTVGTIAFGIYLLLLGINYVPLLVHAVRLAQSETVRETLASDLEDPKGAMRKYRRGSLLLLLPLVVPVLSIYQMRHNKEIPEAPTES